MESVALGADVRYVTMVASRFTASGRLVVDFGASTIRYVSRPKPR